MNSNCLETVGYCLGAAGEQELVIDDSVFRFVESTFTSSEVMTKDDKAFYKINCERSNWQV